MVGVFPYAIPTTYPMCDRYDVGKHRRKLTNGKVEGGYEVMLDVPQDHNKRARGRKCRMQGYLAHKKTLTPPRNPPGP